MSSFYRSGHWRRGKYGSHWVSGHSVDRDGWGNYLANQNYERRLRLSKLKANVGRTSSFVNPNARCPVCNQPVFFYQNSHGSRVFFDELGPPWPKHPCTDIDVVGVGMFPKARTDSEVVEIARLNNLLVKNIDRAFEIKYQRKAVNLMVCLRTIKANSGWLIVLQGLDHDRKGKVFLSRRRPKGLSKGMIVAKKKLIFSWVDIRSLDVVEMKFETIGSIDRLASTFAENDTSGSV